MPAPHSKLALQLSALHPICWLAVALTDGQESPAPHAGKESRDRELCIVSQPDAALAPMMCISSLTITGSVDPVSQAPPKMEKNEQ